MHDSNTSDRLAVKDCRLGYCTRIPLWWFKQSDSVIREMIKHNELSVHVNRTSGVQLGHKSQYIAVETITIFVHKLLEVPIRNKNMIIIMCDKVNTFSPSGWFRYEVETRCS